MSKQQSEPRDEQRPFGIDELFFSTTDRAGVIKSGNSVFCRVANFSSLEEMVGRPHNIIRHPDMPRGVFRLLWDYLEADKPIAAYVKNMALGGAYYWVVALVVPVQGGYLSVRFKPSSPLFDVAQKIYKDLRQMERDAGDKPGVREQAMLRSRDHLLEVLRGEGFEGYDHFMRTMLATEMGSRARLLLERAPVSHDLKGETELVRTLRLCQSLEKELDAIFQRVESFLSLIERLESKAVFLGNLSEEISLLSLNSLIASSHLSEAGRGLSVVADNLATISGDSTQVIIHLNRDIQNLVSSLRDMAFQISAAKLQVGIAVVFLYELLEYEATGSRDYSAMSRDKADLAVLAGSFSREATEISTILPQVREPLEQLIEQVGHLGRSLKTLSKVHVIGRVEAAHVDGATAFLQLFDEVRHQLIAATRELEDFSQTLRPLTEGIPEFEKATDVLQGGLEELAVAS